MELRKETYYLAGILAAIILFWKREQIIETAQEVVHTVKAFTGSRGLRNNNPGNIRKSGDKWQGLAADQSTDSAFFIFDTPEYGIRALVKVLRRYQSSYGLNTISQIIKRWAPPSENNTTSYINAVAKSTGFDANENLDLDNPDVLLPLVKAIIKHENGSNPYPDEQIAMGIGLAF